jgi:hypothetical protein
LDFLFFGFYRKIVDFFPNMAIYSTITVCAYNQYGRDCIRNAIHLAAQGDEHAENYYYVGFTQDLPKRLCFVLFVKKEHFIDHGFFHDFQ